MRAASGGSESHTSSSKSSRGDAAAAGSRCPSSGPRSVAAPFGRASSSSSSSGGPTHAARVCRHQQRPSVLARAADVVPAAGSAVLQQQQQQPSLQWPPQHDQHLHHHQQQQPLRPPVAAAVRSSNGRSQQQQQQQRHHQPHRGRLSSSWQWVASQLELASAASAGCPRAAVSTTATWLIQLAQHGVAPSRAADQAQQQAFAAFLSRVLLQLQQQLRTLLAQQLQQEAPQQLKASGHATQILWSLAKLELLPSAAHAGQWQQQAASAPHQQQQQQQQVLLQQRAAGVVAACADILQQQLQLQPEHCRPRVVAQSVWGLAKLQFMPSPAFWGAYMPAAQQQLPSCSGQDLANMIWGLRQLQQQPSAAWTQHFLAAAADAIVGSRRSVACGGQAAAVMLLNLAELGIQPPQPWIDAVLHSMLAGQRPLLQQLGGYGLASVLGAVDAWGHVPSPGWLCQFQAAVLQRLPDCNGPDAAHLLTSLASLASSSGVALVSSDWQGEQQQQLYGNEQQPGLHYLQQQMQQGSGNSSSISWASEQQQLLLAPVLLQGLTTRLAETAGTTEPEHVVLGLWAAAKLHQLTQPARQQLLQLQEQQQRHEAWLQQQRECQQHWHLCHSVLLHCLSHFEVAGLMGSLSGQSLAQLAWALALAGAAAAADNSSSSSSSSWSRRVSSVVLPLPEQHLTSLLAATRAALPAAEPWSQALLLSALVHAGVQPSWQWLLQFYEASQARLGACNGQDLSMLGLGLVRLGAKPLASWAQAFLAASQRLAQHDNAAEADHEPPLLLSPNCFATIVWAASTPAWGLGGPLPLQQQGGVLVRSPGGSGSGGLVLSSWTAVMQQRLLLLLPQFCMGEVALLLQAAVRLHWCDSSDGSSSSSHAVVQGLLQAGLQLCQQQQQTQLDAGAAAQRAGAALMLLSAALQLPEGVAVHQHWWQAVTQQLQHALQQWQQAALAVGEQQQQEGAAAQLACLSHRQLVRGLGSLPQVLQAMQQQRQPGSNAHNGAIACWALLLGAAAARAPQLNLRRVLQVLTAVADAQHTALQLQEAQPPAACSSAAGCAAAVAQLSQLCQASLLHQLPQLQLKQLAGVLAVASKCALAVPAAAASSGSFSNAGFMQEVLVALEQQLLQLDEDMLEEQQKQQRQQQRLAHVRQQQQLLHAVPADPLLQALQHQRQQQQQQQQVLPTPALPVWLPASHPSPASSSSTSDAAAAAAPHLVRMLAAFARCCYRPPARLLRQMLRVVGAGMAALTPRQLAALADAAAVLQLGSLAGPAFRANLWSALAASLPRQQWRPSSASLGFGAGLGASGSSSDSSAGHSEGAGEQVLLVAKAVNRIATARLRHSSTGSPLSGMALAAACARSCSSGLAVGYPPSRALVAALFDAAAGVAEQLLLPPHALALLPPSLQAQQRRQQRVLLLPLLRLLAPLACYQSADGLKQFTWRVVHKLAVLTEQDKVRARKAVRELLRCWRAGRRRRLLLSGRLQLPQQQRRQLVTPAARVQEQQQPEQQQRRRRPQQQPAQDRADPLLLAHASGAVTAAHQAAAELLLQQAGPTQPVALEPVAAAAAGFTNGRGRGSLHRPTLEVEVLHMQQQQHWPGAAAAPEQPLEAVVLG